MKLKYASVCSGVEAPSQAWEEFGWEAQWFSEIEDFPSKVLAHHYPNVPNLGDMTKLVNNEVFNARDIQLLIGGTPCQSFSVAGLRKGLEDPRGNLALEFVRILSIKKPKWFIWENVPGVLSSGGGRDFASIIGAFAKIGYGVSWRVLDAQFFGVPQRRRRVFVVGYFGNWRPSWRVLFERESLSGDSKKSSEEREGITGDTKSGARKASNGGLTISGKNTFPTLTAAQDSKMWLGNQEAFSGDYFIAQSVSENQRAEVILSDKTGALNTGGGKPGQGYPCVIRYSKSHRINHIEQRVDVDGTTNTLSTGEGCSNQSSQNLVLSQGGLKTNCLTSSYGAVGADFETKPLVFTQNDYARDCFEGLAPTIRSGGDGGIPQLCATTKLGVRRLTPLECERLQGFKDNWTNIPGATNSKRCKACGNSMAVPVIKWLGKRIMEVSGGI